MNDKIKLIALKFLGEYEVVLLDEREVHEGDFFREYALVEHHNLGTKLIFHTSGNDSRVFSVYSVESTTFSNQYFCRKWAQFIEEVEQGE